MTPLFAITTFALGAALLAIWTHTRRSQRAEFIRSYTFPVGLFEKLRRRHPQLSLKDCQLVTQGLRQFFLAHLKSGGQFVSMPSQVADDLWHEFILYTRNYQGFCRQAFGRFMHHTPAVVLGSARQSNAGLRRSWWHACREENIDPRRPTRLPLLFALDTKLGVADGFHYAADCQGLRRQAGADSGPVVYCGGDFSSADVDGSTAGFGESSSGDASADAGGGDGGGGGGGCGGGD